MKTPKERDNMDLLELVCELHARSVNQPRNKFMHDTYWEARRELEARLKNLPQATVSGLQIGGRFNAANVLLYVSVCSALA